MNVSSKVDLKSYENKAFDSSENREASTSLSNNDSRNSSSRRMSDKDKSSSPASDSSSSPSTLSRTTTEQQETTIEFSSFKEDGTELDQKLHLNQNLSFYNKSSNGEKQLERYKRSCYDDEHFTISWEKLDYVVQSKWYKLASQRKLILSNLSGSFKSGQLSAILGPSGAGKSTLIDCLLGKKGNGLTGVTKVNFNNKNLEEERRKKRPLRVATIPQKDHLLDSLTVTETFMYASKIKNAHLDYEEDDDYELEISGQKKQRKAFDHFANVQKVIQQLHLSSCSSLRCGKLSGGQYKRVSIGQELLSRPDLMVLDEPTSGLDSVTCYQTIKALRKLIETSPYPMAIVTTIHQPDVEVFELFHKAYVLASGGRAIYEGPTESIFDTVQSGLKMVETRHSALSFIPSTQDDKTDWQQDDTSMSFLQKQIEERSSNPARLIVELAANKYGYEITNCLNEIQSKEHSNLRAEETSTLSSGADMTTSVSSLSDSSGKTKPSNSASQSSIQPDFKVGPPKFDYEAHDPSVRKANLDKLLSLSAANINQKRTFKVNLKHLVVHTSRSWKTILRDPMLTALQVALHIFVPLLISYCFQGQKSDACPKLGALDVIDEAYRNGTVLDDLNAELRVAFETVSYIFFQAYVILFSAVAMTSLTYPLVMHVLLKEYRNGWYSMKTYFIGRTLADLPVLIFDVVLAMAISYHLTGQPLSPYGWRFASVAAITVLGTIVAQTWGLIFGALLMDAPQSAVFVAPASTAPLVVVSGFLIRVKSLPYILQISSQLSYFTYLMNGVIISRYGFNKCPCKEEDFSIEATHAVPPQARSVIDLWVDSFGPDYNSSNSTVEVNLVGKLVDTISKAKTFGFEMTTCEDVKPFTMLDYELNDSDLFNCYVGLISMIIFFRFLAYFILTQKIKSSL